MEKIHCPFHQEATASCVLYPDAYHCYGCGAHGPLSDLGLETKIPPKERYKENLVTRRIQIESLPTKTIRGFQFPFDDHGYYICWPDSPYFKQRLFNPAPKESKYKNPAGHTQPPFWVRREGFRTVCISEGELNALSIAEAFPEWDVCSPGSASDFKAEKTRSFLLTYCTTYCTVVIVVDRDGAGTEAAIHAKGLLLRKVPIIPIVLMENDANQILCEAGKDTLRQTIGRVLSSMQGKAG